MSTATESPPADARGRADDGSRALSYVPFFGCMIGVKYPQMEASVRRTMGRLGIDLVDIEGFTCCPDPIYFKARDKMDWLTVAARNLTLAEERGRDIVTMCSGCTSTLCEADWLLKNDDELREEINRRLARIGRRYSGSIRVRHLVTVLRDDLGLERVRESVTRPLEGWEVAIHYGCHLLKPAEVMGVDDPDRPSLLADLITATGARPVPHTLQLLCCGKACMSEEIPKQMMLDLLASVDDSGAGCLCLVCPTCFDQFDLGQVKLSRQSERRFEIPVLYYFQLLGLAQGFGPEELGLQYHRIKADRLLERLAA